MFGWFAIVMTAYAKGHGWFPNADVALQYKDWGGLAQIGFGQYISNERAIIMMAHVHALGVSMAAAFGPQVLGDSLTLLDGEADEEPYGLLPPFKGQTGLTPAAEMYNGRMAMMGLSSCLSAPPSRLERTSLRSSTLALAAFSATRVVNQAGTVGLRTV